MLTIVKLSLPRVTARWESILVVQVLFSRHERSPFLFYLIPLFLQALERWRVWLLLGGVEILDGRRLWLARFRDKFLWINMFRHDVLIICKIIDCYFDLYLRGDFALFISIFLEIRMTSQVGVLWKLWTESHPTDYRDITAEVSPRAYPEAFIFFLLCYLGFVASNLEVVSGIAIVWNRG